MDSPVSESTEWAPAWSVAERTAVRPATATAEGRSGTDCNCKPDRCTETWA